MKPQIKDTLKEDNLPTKDNLRVLFHVYNTPYKITSKRATKDRRLGAEHVHCIVWPHEIKPLGIDNII